jgi:hypothetical protein
MGSTSKGKTKEKSNDSPPFALFPFLFNASLAGAGDGNRTHAISLEG